MMLVPLASRRESQTPTSTKRRFGKEHRALPANHKRAGHFHSTGDAPTSGSPRASSRDSQPSACWTRPQPHHGSPFYFNDFNEHLGCVACTLLTEFDIQPTAAAYYHTTCDSLPKHCDRCSHPHGIPRASQRNSRALRGAVLGDD
jgi:hypothetical protein